MAPVRIKTMRKSAIYSKNILQALSTVTSNIIIGYPMAGLVSFPVSSPETCILPRPKVEGGYRSRVKILGRIPIQPCCNLFIPHLTILFLRHHNNFLGLH